MSEKNKYWLVIVAFFLFFEVFSQPQMVLMKELTNQGGIYYYRGEKYTGIGFLKNEKGKFIVEIPLRKGLVHGKRINYTTNGSVLAKEKFKNGKGILITYHINNKLKSSGYINVGFKEGEWKYYNKKGILKAKEMWSFDVENQLDWEKFYYKSGSIESEMYYKMGLLSKEVYYDENGKVFKTNKN